MKNRKLFLLFAITCYLTQSGAPPSLGGVSASRQAAIVGRHNAEADPVLALLWRLCSKQALRGRSGCPGRFRRPGVVFHLIDGGFVVGGVHTDAK